MTNTDKARPKPAYAQPREGNLVLRFNGVRLARQSILPLALDRMVHAR